MLDERDEEVAGVVVGGGERGDGDVDEEEASISMSTRADPT